MATPTKFEANGFAAMVAVIGMICAIYAGYRYAQDPTTARLTSLCLWVVGAIYTSAFFFNFSISVSDFEAKDKSKSG